MAMRSHSHINWRERAHLLGQNGKSKKRLDAAKACDYCLSILDFTPQYNNADLAEAEHIHKLRSTGLPIETISIREGLSSIYIVDRVKLWQVDTEIKELIENGDMVVAEVMRLVRA